MDDPRTADGVEHLQAAARELLLAARSFLSVVEEVVATFCRNVASSASRSAGLNEVTTRPSSRSMVESSAICNT